MTERFRAALLFLSVSFVVAGCGSSASTSTNVSSPDAPRCQPTVAPSATTYGSAGGNGSLNITVARECTWSAASAAPWITLTSAREGQGEGSVTYRMDANGDPVTRRGALSVVSGGEARIELSQDAAPCRFQVTAASEPALADGGERLITVRTHAVCGWTAVSTVPWMAPTPANGRGDGVVRVVFAANAGAARSADIVVADERFTLTQSARTAPPPPAPAPPGPTPPPPTPPAPPPPSPLPPTPQPTPPAPPAPPAPPTAGPRIELEGRISSLSGSCPSLTFRAEGRTVWTTSDTRFRKGSCGDLRDNTEVEIEGRLMSDGTVRADDIRMERD